MRALTIKQPWASLIASGRKRVENRTWPTDYRGELAIHAAINDDAVAPDDLARPYRLEPRGAIIAVAELVDCVTYDELAEDPTLDDQREWATGPRCLILGQVRPVAPIYCRGHQRLWTPTQDQIAQLHTIPITAFTRGGEPVFRPRMWSQIN